MSAHASSAPPEPKGGLGIPKIIGVVLVILGVFVMIGLWIKSENNNAPTDTAAATAPIALDTIEVLVNPPRACLTPCTLRIDKKSRIERYGDSIRVDWPGVGWVKYTDPVETNAPPNTEKGAVVFESLNPSKPHVMIRVYDIMTQVIHK